VKAIVIPKEDAISEAFGMFRGLKERSGQQMKDEIRKELHGM
jgi:VIT1/CCC1 family predicted Fe2+/Mn2+ transporter